MDAPDIFHKLIEGIASVSHDCSCGRVNYSTHDTRDYEDGELQELETNRKKFPEKYIPHSGSSVSVKHILGRSYVIDCPCNWEEKTLNLIWSNKNWIMELIEIVTKNKLEEAEKSTNIIDRHHRHMKNLNGDIKRATD